MTTSEKKKKVQEFFSPKNGELSPRSISYERMEEIYDEIQEFKISLAKMSESYVRWNRALEGCVSSLGHIQDHMETINELIMNTLAQTRNLIDPK